MCWSSVKTLQRQPGGLTIHARKWFLRAVFLGASPISLRQPGSPASRRLRDERGFCRRATNCYLSQYLILSAHMFPHVIIVCHMLPIVSRPRQAPRWSDRQGNPHTRESRILAPVRPMVTLWKSRKLLWNPEIAFEDRPAREPADGARWCASMMRSSRRARDGGGRRARDQTNEQLPHRRRRNSKAFEKHIQT